MLQLLRFFQEFSYVDGVSVLSRERCEESLKPLLFNTEIEKLEAKLKMISSHFSIAQVFETENGLKYHLIIQASFSHAGAKVDYDLVSLSQVTYSILDILDESLISSVVHV